MSAQRFIATKVGDRYVTVPVEDSGTLAAYTAGGAAVLGMGLLRRGVSGFVLTLLGGGLIYRGLTGRNPLEHFACGAMRSSSDDESGPSYQHDFESHARQAPEDEVDEASMESFPASDAPARSNVATSG